MCLQFLLQPQWESIKALIYNVRKNVLFKNLIVNNLKYVIQIKCAKTKRLTFYFIPPN